MARSDQKRTRLALKNDALSHWKQIGLRPHHGISVPLFAVHSDKKGGGGDFFDLYPLIDWCAHLGLDTIQLLPLNDTGSGTSPYGIISSIALDSTYLYIKDLQLGKHLTRQEIKQHKETWLINAYQEQFSAVAKTAAYQTFLHDHRDWLPFYSKYKGGPSEFHAFVQFLCFSQMTQIKKYASEKQIYLMGDLPFFMLSESADVFENPHLFDPSLCAGAPPDLYNPEGQNWGFPIFNYEAMEKEDFQWWKRRLKAIENIYHIYRIDHVIGLFRTWAIMNGQGSFIPSDPNEWPRLGAKGLQHLLADSDLFPIAEDLGTMTSSMRSVLEKMDICTTKVMRWEINQPFDSYNPFSMTTLSTHDMEPTPLWWKNNPQEAALCAEKNHWDYRPDLTRDQLFALLQQSHATASYFHINPLQEYLLLFPELSHPSLDEERINKPGVVSAENWNYRFLPSLETITHHAGLQQTMKLLISR